MIVYHVYGNDGHGAPVDYTTILATVSGLTWNTPSLPAGARSTFAVRAFDPSTGLEDENVDARLSVVLDSLGNDLTGLPNAPSSLSVRATAAGTAVATWVYNPGGQGSAPTIFHVYLGTPTANFAAPVTTTAYSNGRRTFSASLSGLSHGTTYQVVVRSANASGEEPNRVAATVVGAVTGPLAVDALAVAVVA